jgi:hypothetical protein
MPSASGATIMNTLSTSHLVNRPLVIGVYVEDLLIADPVDTDIDQFKQETCKRFQISDLGVLTYYLGIEV